MPEQTCVLDYEDGIHCFCNTDFCNAPNMFRLNMTVLPIIECKEVYEKEYRAAACNKCTWKVDYMAYDKTLAPSNAVENVQCGYSGQSGPFNLDLVSHIYDRIGLNFFNDGCYNISMNPQQYNLYCRCSTALCNNPEGSLPFPLPAPRISCYTSGFDSDVNNAKYDTPEASYYDVYAQLVKNDSYYDKDSKLAG
ncbi:hypothetical protein L5515_007303 [Caenorhabditis briggsae]|uniref:Uncharacterized protein n=2 Tax=Caenorhabditis briggsae TaxID=6238 RepID=A0AAE9EY65_CAEBR|nr:hypothetical protein L5515_007303 [Caenorhabditis briggsae]